MKKNEQLTVIVQIEHYNAVAEIDQILSTPGFRGLFRAYDLSGSMGLPGQFDHPDMIAAIQTVANAAKKTGKLLGAHVLPQTIRQCRSFRAKATTF